MTTDKPDNVVSILSAAPSIERKEYPPGDKRLTCSHHQVVISIREPILECRSCKAILDPWQYIRGLSDRWNGMVRAVETKVEAKKQELADLEKALRLVRGDYRDEIERREAQRAIAVLPPSRGRRR